MENLELQHHSWHHPSPTSPDHPPSLPRLELHLDLGRVEPLTPLPLPLTFDLCLQLRLLLFVGRWGPELLPQSELGKYSCCGVFEYLHAASEIVFRILAQLLENTGFGRWDQSCNLLCLDRSLSGEFTLITDY